MLEHWTLKNQIWIYFSLAFSAIGSLVFLPNCPGSLRSLAITRHGWNPAMDGLYNSNLYQTLAVFWSNQVFLMKTLEESTLLQVNRPFSKPIFIEQEPCQPEPSPPSAHPSATHFSHQNFGLLPNHCDLTVRSTAAKAGSTREKQTWVVAKGVLVCFLEQPDTCDTWQA